MTSALKKIFNTRFTTFSIFCLIYYQLLCKQNKLIQSGFSFKVTNTDIVEEGSGSRNTVFMIRNK